MAGDDDSAGEGNRWPAYAGDDSRWQYVPEIPIEIELRGRVLTVRTEAREESFDIGSAEIDFAPWGTEPAYGSVLEIEGSRALRIGGLDVFALGLVRNRPALVRVNVFLRRPAFMELVRAVLEKRAEISPTSRQDADGPYRSGIREGETALSMVRVMRALSAPTSKPVEIAIADASLKSDPIWIGVGLVPLLLVLAAQPDAWATLLVMAGVIVGVSWITRRRRHKGVFVFSDKHAELREPGSGRVRAQVGRNHLEVVQGFWRGRRRFGPALEIRLGWKSKIVIGTSPTWQCERERHGVPLEPSVYVDRFTWWALRRALEDRLV